MCHEIILTYFKNFLKIAIEFPYSISNIYEQISNDFVFCFSSHILKFSWNYFKIPRNSSNMSSKFVQFCKCFIVILPILSLFFFNY